MGSITAVGHWFSRLRRAQSDPAPPATARTPEGVRAYRRPEVKSRPANWALSGTGMRFPSELSTDRLHDEMWRTVPLLDRATRQLAQLVGGVRFSGPEKEVHALHDWATRVQVGAVGQGLETFLQAHVVSALVYGRAIGEIVPEAKAADIRALVNVFAPTVQIETTHDPLAAAFYQQQSGGRRELPRELTLYSRYGESTDRIYGCSLFRSLPYVIRVSRIIENAVAQVWQRHGTPLAHLNVQVEEIHDPLGEEAGEVLDQLAGQWEDVMEARADNTVADLVTYGNVKATLLGQDGPIVSMQEPYRSFAEQVICVTGLPPWALGLEWVGAAHVAREQVELLINHTEAIRKSLDPMLHHLLTMRQRMVGRQEVRYTWSPITLRNANEIARARAWTAQAREREIANAQRMWALGLWSQQRCLQELDPDANSVARPLETPPELDDPKTRPLDPGD